MLLLYTDGEECPVALLWHSGHGPNSDHFSTIADLDRIPCATRLDISSQNFVKEGSNCSHGFKWKGTSDLVCISSQSACS